LSAAFLAGAVSIGTYRFPFLIREKQQRGSQFGGLGVLRSSGGANAVAGCRPTSYRKNGMVRNRSRLSLRPPQLTPSPVSQSEALLPGAREFTRDER